VSGYEQFSKEVLIKKDPQIIITADPDFFYKNKEFQNMTAVKNKRILTMKNDSLSIAGPRFIDGIEELIQIIYSPRFIKYIHDNKGAKEN
jgi:iron complex transport system substrate-binding protein